MQTRNWGPHYSAWEENLDAHMPSNDSVLTKMLLTFIVANYGTLVTRLQERVLDECFHSKNTAKKNQWLPPCGSRQATARRSQIIKQPGGKISYWNQPTKPTNIRMVKSRKTRHQEPLKTVTTTRKGTRPNRNRDRWCNTNTNKQQRKRQQTRRTQAHKFPSHEYLNYGTTSHGDHYRNKTFNRNLWTQIHKQKALNLDD